MRSPRHPDLLLACAAIAFTCVVAEVALRLFWHPDAEASVIRADPRYGWALRPGSHLHSVASDRGLDYHIDINALGLRDAPRAQRPPLGVRRVLFIGDSMVFGAGVEARDRLTERLQDILGGDFEVVNAGVSGWGTDQEFLWLQNEGLALHPDVVVLGVCMLNDVLNVMLPHELFGTAPKPRFDLKDGQLALVPAPARDEVRENASVGGFAKHSRLVHFVGRHVRLLASRLRTAPHRTDAPFYPEDIESDSSHWSVFRTQYTPRFEAAFEVTEALVTAIHDTCAAHGIPLLIYAFPQKVEVDVADRKRELDHFGYDPAQFDLAAPYARMGRLAQSLGVPWVYPVEEWTEMQQRVPLFFARDGHPNPDGHALAAANIAPALHNLLEHTVSSRH